MDLSNLSSCRKELLDLYGKKEKDVENDLLILREWMKKQPHLPSDKIQDFFLETILLKNKYSIEKTKRKIENYCTLKASPRLQYLFSKIPVPSQEPIFYVPLWKLTKDYKRIFFVKLKDENEYDMQRDVSSSLWLHEIITRYDHSDGHIIVIDYSNASARIISKLRAGVLSDAFTLAFEGFSARLSEIHCINKTANILFSTVKSLLPQKVVSKFHLHSDFETLKNRFPEEYLPKDFGGKLQSLDEMLVEWDSIFEKNKELLQFFMDTKAREDLRTADIQSDMKGTFRKLDID